MSCRETRIVDLVVGMKPVSLLSVRTSPTSAAIDYDTVFRFQMRVQKRMGSYRCIDLRKWFNRDMIGIRLAEKNRKSAP